MVLLALAAPAAEHDLGAGDLEAGTRAGRNPDVGELGVEIAHPATGLTHQVVVRVDGGVEPGRAGAELELLQLAHGGQIVQGLVDGAERDRRHLAADVRVDRFGGRVLLALVEHPEYALALWSDLESAGPEEAGELIGGLHGGDDITIDVDQQFLSSVRPGVGRHNAPSMGLV